MAQPSMRHISEQLSKWTIVGPFFCPDNNNTWFAADLDAPRSLPKSLAIGGKNIAVRNVKLDKSNMDFRQILGVSSGSPQAYAITQLEVSEACTVKITYDADWSAAWWLDGVEIFDTRLGNTGTVGEVHHPLMLGLKPGKHILASRIVSGVKGWGLMFNVEYVKPGIEDLLLTDRTAKWRRYTQTMVRHEARPTPDGTIGSSIPEVYEQACANFGVDSRWISVVDQAGTPRFKSQVLPDGEPSTEEHERNLLNWVKLLHQHKISAMTWYPMVLCESGWQANPDWRQQYLFDNGGNKLDCCKFACCINSGYGQALIDFSIETLTKFDLDGIWFDGSAFTPIWQTPQPISCVCEHCRKKFHAAYGMDLPKERDWSQPQMQRFVKWRYENFSAYWQHLVDSVHAVVPEAAIAFNHYHREGCGWNSAIPLEPFGHDFVSGIEADDTPLKADLYTRMMRAYGRGNEECWMTMNVGKMNTPRGRYHHPRKFIDFTIAAATAGGNASFGCGTIDVIMPTIHEVSKQLHMRKPYLHLPPVPYLAMHISQQSDTFVFGRNPAYNDDQNWKDFYWNSVVGWHQALVFSGRPCDVVFDAHLTAAKLKDYPILLMPLAVSLESPQYEQVIKYARAGGTVIAGPWFGLCDKWGNKHEKPVGDRQLMPFGQTLPSWKEMENLRQLTFQIVSEGKTQRLQAAPFAAECVKEKIVKLDWSTAGKFIRRTRVGKGQIVQLAVDLGTLFRYSNSPLAAAAVGNLFADLARPLIETIGSQPLLTGTFKKDKRTTVVHLQQFSPPWDAHAADTQPPTRWNTEIRWNGPRPTSVRCALPEVGPELPIKKSGKGWSFILPPMDWGQILLIQS